jgi:putative transposase
MKTRRHSPDEISAKLHQAGTLASQGRSQSEIAKALGVSVMTYHRWRKQNPSGPLLRPDPVAAVEPLTQQEQADRIRELQLENERLRRLVTDLLLEKMKLEEALNPSKRALL